LSDTGDTDTAVTNATVVDPACIHATKNSRWTMAEDEIVLMHVKDKGWKSISDVVNENKPKGQEQMRSANAVRMRYEKHLRPRLVSAEEVSDYINPEI
jgi:hypothetical protein